MYAVAEEPGFRIRHARNDASTIAALADILVDAVDGGASVGFLALLPLTKAARFWETVLASAARGERVVLVAEDIATETIAGTVQLIPAAAENQPHRADVAKMLVHRQARGRGIGTALLRAIEAEACRLNRSVLVLDTATGSDAERLYARAGWRRCGVIPEYAFWPDAERKCSTTVFYRQLEGCLEEMPLEAARREAMLGA